MDVGIKKKNRKKEFKKVRGKNNKLVNHEYINTHDVILILILTSVET